MFIQPNSTIMILNNVPLDTTYNHTLWFDSPASQSAYFSSKMKYTFPAQSYQRKERGSMSIQVSADNIYDCNYLMFQNTSYGNKWFYAFITGVEYVNNANALVTFEIDPMQTYLFDVELKQCYVEREHSSTDVAGDNVVDEPINTGDLVCAGISYVDGMNDYVGMIWHAGLHTGDVVGGIYSNMFSGLDVTVSPLPDGVQSADALRNLLADFTDNDKTEAIVSVTAMPMKFFNAVPTPVQYNHNVPKPTSLVNGYVPRNKKLLTFPFNYLVVDCGNDTGIYRYEWFTNTTNTTWRLIGFASPNPQIACIPKNYNGVSTNEGYPNVTEELIMEGFPQLPFNIDGYRAYLAQSGLGSALNGVEDVLQTTSERQFTGGKNGQPTGFERYSGKAPVHSPIISGVTNWAKNLISGNSGSDVVDTYTKSVQSAKHPNKSTGTMTAGVATALRYKNFYFKQMTVSTSYAQIIDNYFDMFGYATKRIKVPNRTVRPHWNYVKTNGCVVVGNAPADDVQQICRIYDSGITFWKNASEVGNYSLNNSLS